MSHSFTQKTIAQDEPAKKVSESTPESSDFNDINLASVSKFTTQPETIPSDSIQLTGVTLEELLKAIKLTKRDPESSNQSSQHTEGVLSEVTIHKIITLYEADPGKVKEVISELRTSQQEATAKAEHLKDLNKELVLPNTKLGLSPVASRQQRNLEEKLTERIAPLIASIQLTERILQDDPSKIREVSSTDGKIRDLWKYSPHHRSPQRTDLKNFSIDLNKSDFFEWKWTAVDVVSAPFFALFRFLSAPIDDPRGTFTGNFSYRTPTLSIEKSPSVQRLKEVAAEANFDVDISLVSNHRGGTDFAQLRFEMTHRAAHSDVSQV